MTSTEFIEFYKKLTSLSQREFECLDLVSKGFLSKEIGYRLKISESTVYVFLKRARQKMNFHNTKSMISNYQSSYLFLIIYLFSCKGFGYMT